MRVTTTTVVATGVGKPDYSRDVSAAIQRAGFRLKYGQTAVILTKSFTPIVSPYAWVVGQLAIGASARLTDMSTGIDTPYTVPVGYTLAMVEIAEVFSQDVESGFYLDGGLLSVGVHMNGLPIVENKILPWTTGLIDPIGAFVHTLDGLYTNVGGAAMTGGIVILCILEAVGTKPLPKTKTVKCKWCGYEQVVPRDLTSMRCPKCDEITMYANTSAFRRTP